MESKLKDDWCGFYPWHSTMDQTFTLGKIFLKPWEYAKEAFTCFVDLQNTHDQVPRTKLSRVLQKYGINGASVDGHSVTLLPA